MKQQGDKAPSFTVQDTEGNTVTLSDYKGKYVVLYFYPKDMTPGCTTEACEFRDSHEEFKKKNVVVFGVSIDTEASHKRFAKKHNLNFPLLADVDKKINESYGVWAEKSFLGKKFFGTTRTTFIIGPEGTIAKVYEKVKAKGHAKDVLSFFN